MGEQNETQKLSYGVDWLQKVIRYGPSHLDNRLFQNVQNIWRSHKVYRGNHEKLESGIDSYRKNIRWGEDPEGYIPGRCTITITICNSDDATQLHA